MRAVSHRIAARVLIATLVLGGVAALPTTARAAVTEALPATDLQAEVNYDEVKLTWTNPATADFSETVIRGKAGLAAPSGPEDGFAVPPGLSIVPTATATDLDVGTPYTFAAFARNLAGEYAAPATVSVNYMAVTATVSPDRAVYGRTVTLSGRVTDGFTGAPIEYADIRILARPQATGEFLLISEDFTRTGGTYSIPLTPPENAEFVVIAYGDAQHLVGGAATRLVTISSAVYLEPVLKKAKLGTTFPLVAGADPIHRGVPLVLEEKIKNKWKPLLKQKPNKNGITKFKVKPKTKGKHVYRVTKAKTPATGAGVSRQVTIRVT